MTNLLDENPEAAAWVDRTKAALNLNGAFGQLRGGVVWSDATGDDGQLLVPGDPEKIVAEINADSFPLLKGHDPGFPIGKLLAADVFTSGSGKKFVAAVLGYYDGARLSFFDLGLHPTGPVYSPARLPALPDDCWIALATDPREVEAAWVEDAVRTAPMRVEESELSHNAADVEAELIRLGVLFVALVWVPFVTAVASEAGRDAYSKLHRWLRGRVHKLAELRNPILEIQSHHGGCYVSFLLRGKNLKRNNLAFDALPAAAAQAQHLIRNMKESGFAPKALVYEFHPQDDIWFPSYAELHDGRLVTDNRVLIATERLPLGLSLCFQRGKHKSRLPSVRQLPRDATMQSEVFWYALKRATPLHTGGVKDEWSLPGAKDQDEALFYFGQEEDLNCRLAFCDEDETGEFVLERWTRHIPGPNHVQRGEFVDGAWVRRSE